MPPLRERVRDHLRSRIGADHKERIKAVLGRFGIVYELQLDAFRVDRGAVAHAHDDELSELFFGYDGGAVVHKWVHYLPVYSRLFEPYRARLRAGRPLRFLEIGVSKGGSLDLWRRYFGADAVIYGIDVDPRCAAFDGRSARVRIGSQADPDFLRSVVREMGGIDVVLDDGSHRAAHQRVALETLFPLLSPDGLYVAEDLHCAYWLGFGGGYRRRGSFVEIAKDLIDDMHHWYHRRPRRHAGIAVGAIHVYDSLIALEKAADRKPVHTMVGGPRG